MNNAAVFQTTNVMPVDKGGLEPVPQQPRLRLQRVCFMIAAGFALLGVASLAFMGAAVLIIVAMPVTFFLICGFALDMPRPLLRQRVMLGSVLVTALTAIGLGMMPLHLTGFAETVRQLGFAVCGATTVLSALAAVLPPYRSTTAREKALRFSSFLFCLCTYVFAYACSTMICTPAGY